MLNPVILSDDSGMLQAVVLPGEGMTLSSLQLDGIEAICQDRAREYQACRKGFGPLIGPHFNQRVQLPAAALENPGRWPQAAALAQLGIRDIWQHGVARYVPWDYTVMPDGIRASLTGRRRLAGILLRDIQGGDFELRLEMRIDGASLRIHYTAEADFPPVIGLHYYYELPDDRGRVRAPVTGWMQPHQPAVAIPAAWMDAAGRRLELELDRELDHVFPLRPGPIELETSTHRVWTIPEMGVQSLVVFHPGPNGWVCVEPLSAANPRQPSGTRAEMALTIRLEPA